MRKKSPNSKTSIKYNTNCNKKSYFKSWTLKLHSIVDFRGLDPALASPCLQEISHFCLFRSNRVLWWFLFSAFDSCDTLIHYKSTFNAHTANKPLISLMKITWHLHFSASKKYLTFLYFGQFAVLWWFWVSGFDSCDTFIHYKPISNDQTAIKPVIPSIKNTWHLHPSASKKYLTRMFYFALFHSKINYGIVTWS